MDDIKQKYQAEIRVYYGRKIHLSENDNYTIKFNLKDGWRAELDCGFTKDNQKTLSSTRPSFVTITSGLSIEDINHKINVNDKFVIHDIDGKLGKGKIIEILKQE